jgi:hypothetical protein
VDGSAQHAWVVKQGLHADGRTCYGDYRACRARCICLASKTSQKHLPSLQNKPENSPQLLAHSCSRRASCCTPAHHTAAIAAMVPYSPSKTLTPKPITTHLFGQAASLVSVADWQVAGAAVLLVGAAGGSLHGAAAPAEAEASDVTVGMTNSSNRRQRKARACVSKSECECRMPAMPACHSIASAVV